MKVTKHARLRMKERCGFPKKAQERMTEKVFSEGITHAQTKGRLNKWITGLYSKNTNAKVDMLDVNQRSRILGVIFY